MSFCILELRLKKHKKTYINRNRSINTREMCILIWKNVKNRQDHWLQKAYFHDRKSPSANLHSTKHSIKDTASAPVMKTKYLQNYAIYTLSPNSLPDN